MTKRKGPKPSKARLTDALTREAFEAYKADIEATVQWSDLHSLYAHFGVLHADDMPELHQLNMQRLAEIAKVPAASADNYNNEGDT